MSATPPEGLHRSTTFLYTVQPTDAAKRLQARPWLKELAKADTGVTNLQVLNEVTNVLTKKASRFDRSDPIVQVDGFAEFGSAPIESATVVAARAIYCLLLASALELGCKFFLSEDLQDGQVIEGLTIVNPFAHSPEQIFSSR